jgi:hypothetical protein
MAGLKRIKILAQESIWEQGGVLGKQTRFPKQKKAGEQFSV